MSVTESSRRWPPHFSLAELTVSETAERQGIDNTPPPAIVEKLRFTAHAMESVRDLLGVPVVVLSGYRSPELNRAVGGSANSQHMRGEACDFIASRYGPPLAICRAIVDSDLPFDQLIFEGGWVHISFVADRKPRGEVLTWKRGQGYSIGINP